MLTQDASNMIDAPPQRLGQRARRRTQKLLAKDKISQGTFDTAKRFANSSRFLDQELVRQLIKGKIHADDFKNMHPISTRTRETPPTALACRNSPSRRSLEKSNRTNLKRPRSVSRVTAWITSDAADAFIKDPNRAKDFAEFLLKNPLKKEAQALRDLPGASALDVQQDILGRELATFKAKKSAMCSEKIDTPESAEKVKGLMKEFEETSKSHSEHWNQLTAMFQQISRR